MASSYSVRVQELMYKLLFATLPELELLRRTVLLLLELLLIIFDTLKNLASGAYALLILVYPAYSLLALKAIPARLIIAIGAWIGGFR